MSNIAQQESSHGTGTSARPSGLLSLSAAFAGGSVILAAAIGMWPAFTLLAEKWSESVSNSSSYSHGYLVALISGYLLFSALARPQATPEKFSPILILLVPTLMVWCLAYVADIEIGMWVLLPPILALSLVAVLGWNIAKVTFFPLAYLYFAIPVWDYFNGYLLYGTVLAVESMLQLMHVTALVEGNRVFISSGTFEIAGGCSGIHFFIVSLALAALYGYLYLVTWRNRIVLGLVAAGLALLTNWIRVATIIYAGDATAMQHFLVTVDHYYFGWALFGLSLIPFFMVAGKLRPPLDQTDTVNARSADTVAGNSQFSLPVLLLTMLVLLAPSLYWILRDTSPVTGISLGLPVVVDWEGPIEEHVDWRPIFPEASGESHGRYVQAGTTLDVYINVYRNQTQGRELVGYGNSVFGGRYETILSAEFVALSYQDGEAFHGHRVLLAGPGDNRRVVLYWYLVGKSRTANPLRAKAYQAAWGLVGNHEAGLVAVSSTCEGECGPAIEAVNEFSVAAGQALEAATQAIQGDSDG